MFWHLFDPTVFANEEKHPVKSTCNKEPECIKLELNRSLNLSTQDLFPCFEYLLSGKGSFLKQEESQLPKTPPPEGNTCVRGLGKAVLAQSSAAMRNLHAFCVMFFWSKALPWGGYMPVTHPSLLKGLWWWQVGWSTDKKSTNNT